MKLQHFAFGIVLASLLGCESAPSAQPVETTLAATPAPAQTAAPTASGASTIKSRSKPAEYKFGCNYNTSCKLNCEWCGVNGTCTCRLKGID